MTTAEEYFKVFSRQRKNGLSFEEAMASIIRSNTSDIVREVGRFSKVQGELDIEHVEAILANAFDIANNRWLSFSRMVCDASGLPVGPLSRLFEESIYVIGPTMRRVVECWREGAHLDLESAGDC